MEKQELIEQLEQIELEKDREFLQRYNDLCGEYKRELSSQMILVAGQAPIMQWGVNRAKD